MRMEHFASKLIPKYLGRLLSPVPKTETNFSTSAFAVAVEEMQELTMGSGQWTRRVSSTSSCCHADRLAAIHGGWKAAVQQHLCSVVVWLNFEEGLITQMLFLLLEILKLTLLLLDDMPFNLMINTAQSNKAWVPSKMRLLWMVRKKEDGNRETLF